MTATRRPASSTVSSHAAEWNDGPANCSRPAMAGNDGRLSWPTAQTIPSTTSVVSVPSPVRTRQRPDAGVLVEAGLGHLAAEADALLEPEVLGRRLQVGQQVGLGREAGDPPVGLREGVAVELIGDVDAAPRIHVLEPGPAHVAVLLEHRHRHAGLAQAVCRGQAGGTSPDDGAPKGAVGLRDAPRRCPWVVPRERELLGQELVPVLCRAGADEEPEDAPHAPAPSLHGRAGPRPGGPPTRRSPAPAPRPPAPERGRARAPTAGPGPARTPPGATTSRPCGAPRHTAADARLPRHRPPANRERRHPHPCRGA